MKYQFYMHHMQSECLFLAQRYLYFKSIYMHCGRSIEHYAWIWIHQYRLSVFFMRDLKFVTYFLVYYRIMCWYQFILLINHLNLELVVILFGLCTGHLENGPSTILGWQPKWISLCFSRKICRVFLVFSSRTTSTRQASYDK